MSWLLLILVISMYGLSMKFSMEPCAVCHDGHMYHNAEKQMSSIEAAMLRIRVFWHVTQHQLFLTFHRNVAFILKDPCALEDRALHHMQTSVATHPAAQLHILEDSSSHNLHSGTLTTSFTCAL